MISGVLFIELDLVRLTWAPLSNDTPNALAFEVSMRSRPFGLACVYFEKLRGLPRPVAAAATALFYYC